MERTERMEKFQIKMYLAACELSAVVRELMACPDPREVYKKYMTALYSIIKSTENILQVAIEETERRLKAGDASCAELLEYFIKHKKEEVEHDQWLLEDLVSLGVSAEEVVSLRPSAETAALVGSQYYWMYHYHPALLLGYLAIFESYPMGIEQINEWQRLTGYPDSAFRTLRLHTELDPYHAIDLNVIIGTFAMRNEIIDPITTSMFTSCGYVGRVFSALIEDSRAKSALAAVSIPTDGGLVSA